MFDFEPEMMILFTQADDPLNLLKQVSVCQQPSVRLGFSGFKSTLLTSGREYNESHIRPMP